MRPIAPAKRARLIVAACELIHRQGVARTTLADIAAAADVPRRQRDLLLQDQGRHRRRRRSCPGQSDRIGHGRLGAEISQPQGSTTRGWSACWPNTPTQLPTTAARMGRCAWSWPSARRDQTRSLPGRCGRRWAGPSNSSARWAGVTPMTLRLSCWRPIEGSAVLTSTLGQPDLMVRQSPAPREIDRGAPRVKVQAQNDFRRDWIQTGKESQGS